MTPHLNRLNDTTYGLMRNKKNYLQILALTCIYSSVAIFGKFDISITNDVVSFEQLGPGLVNTTEINLQSAKSRNS